MKIAIISDTHDNLFNFAKFAKYAAEFGVGAIIHCGDVASPETFGEIVANWSEITRLDASRVKVFLALGNMDAGRGGAEAYLKEVGKKSKNGEVKVFENMGEVEIDGIKIAFGHEPKKMRSVAESRLRFEITKTSASQGGKYDFVFYGHTHKPWMEVLQNGCIFANPGNLSDAGYLSTFAILDIVSKKLELKILKDLKLP